MEAPFPMCLLCMDKAEGCPLPTRQLILFSYDPKANVLFLSTVRPTAVKGLARVIKPINGGAEIHAQLRLDLKHINATAR